MAAPACCAGEISQNDAHAHPMSAPRRVRCEVMPSREAARSKRSQSFRIDRLGRRRRTVSSQLRNPSPTTRPALREIVVTYIRALGCAHVSPYRLTTLKSGGLLSCRQQNDAQGKNIDRSISSTTDSMPVAAIPSIPIAQWNAAASGTRDSGCPPHESHPCHDRLNAR